MNNLPVFVQVYDSATSKTVSVDRATFADFEEARAFKDWLERFYGKTSPQKVRLLIELYPSTEQDIEEEFDSDELEEEE